MKWLLLNSFGVKYEYLGSGIWYVSFDKTLDGVPINTIMYNPRFSETFADLLILNSID